jgi:hypothetical protein
MTAKAPKKRIETQIPRRKQGKKVYPLESEWEIQSATPPQQLRMPRENMGPARKG